MNIGLEEFRSVPKFSDDLSFNILQGSLTSCGLTQAFSGGQTLPQSKRQRIMKTSHLFGFDYML